MVKVSYDEINYFYDDIKSMTCGRKSCSVLILVTHEIDALSSTRMLTQLMRNDNITYSIISIADSSNLEQVAITNDVKCVFMINCGATVNVSQKFSLDEQGGQLRCFILDNQRPIHLANVYSRHNVVIFDDEIGSKNEGENDNDDIYDNRSIPSNGSILSVQSDDTTSDEESSNESEFDDSSENGLDIDDYEDQVEEEGDNSFHKEEGFIIGQTHTGSVVHITPDENETEVNDTSGEDFNQVDETASISNQEDNSCKGENRDEEENDDEEDDEMVNQRKRRRVPVISSLKIRKIKLKSYYYQNCYYTTPTSVILMNLVCSRLGVGVPIDTLWQGAIGAYDQYERNNITDDAYDLLCDRIKLLLGNHMDMTSSSSARYTVSEDISIISTSSVASAAASPASVNSSQSSIVVTNAETGNIVEGTEYRFFLYKHWSIYQSMLHSPYILIKLMTWKPTGLLRLQELLALLGLSLSQSKQNFSLLSPQLKNDVLHDLVNKEAIKRNYNLFDPDVTIRCFCRYTMFRTPVSTKDMVIAASSFLDVCSINGSNINDSDNNQKLTFNQAYDCLSTKSDELLKKGINLAILIQTAIVKKVTALLENYDAITRVQRMYFTYIHKVGHSSDININMNILNADTSNNVSSTTIYPSDFDIQAIFSNPRVILKIGNLLMSIKMNISKRDGGWLGSKLLPIFLLCEKKDAAVIVGISPLSYLQSSSSLVNVDAKQMELLKKISNFYLYFSLAAKEMKMPINLKFGFNPNVCEIARRDVPDFLGTLDYLFKKAT